MKDSLPLVVRWSGDGPMKSTDCRSIVAQLSADSRHSVPITKSQKIGEQREKNYNLAPSAKKKKKKKKKIDRQEKQLNSSTMSADCPSTVALFWPHRHWPLVGLGNVTGVLRWHLILPIILKGSTLGFYCVKNAKWTHPILHIKRVYFIYAFCMVTLYQPCITCTV